MRWGKTVPSPLLPCSYVPCNDKSACSSEQGLDKPDPLPLFVLVLINIACAVGRRPVRTSHHSCLCVVCFHSSCLMHSFLHSWFAFPALFFPAHPHPPPRMTRSPRTTQPSSEAAITPTFKSFSSTTGTTVRNPSAVRSLTSFTVPRRRSTKFTTCQVCLVVWNPSSLSVGSVSVGGVSFVLGLKRVAVGNRTSNDG